MTMTRRSDPTRNLEAQVQELQAQLAEAQDALEAIHRGQVDAIIVSGPDGERIFSLTETASVYRRVVETMSESGLTVSPEGIIIFCNDRFANLLGLPMTRIVARPLADFVAPSHRPALARLLQTAPTRPASARILLEVPHHPGLPIHFWANYLPPPDGPLVCLVGTDLSQLEMDQETILQLQEQRSALQESENRARQTAEDLARSNRDLEQFAYVASHDLQEPLRMVSGFMDLLEDRYAGQLDVRGREYVHFALEGAQRAQRLVADLLQYSRAGRDEQLQTTDAQAALAEALANLRTAIDETGATVTHDPLPVVQADPTRLVQLLQNLIANAIKFRRDEPPRVHVAASARDGQWLFAVQDNGIGIPPDQYERIFLIFQRLHLRETYPGTGVGLAICKRIVERHGGRIWVESQPGQGTTFYFTLHRGEA